MRRLMQRLLRRRKKTFDEKCELEAVHLVQDGMERQLEGYERELRLLRARVAATTGRKFQPRGR